MRARAALLAALGLIAGVCGALEPSGEGDARAVLAAMKAASGGARWDDVRSIHYEARVRSSRSMGSAISREDTLRGFYADHYTQGPIRGAQGYDGRRLWVINQAGELVFPDDAASLAEAVNEAYRRSLSYWYPDRRPADLRHGGQVEEDGRRFDVVTITPLGGSAFEFWIDRRTQLLDRLIERTANGLRTTYFGDYRRLQGRLVPFAARTTFGDPNDETLVEFTSIRFNEKLAEDAFAPPAQARTASRTD